MRQTQTELLLERFGHDVRGLETSQENLDGMFEDLEYLLTKKTGKHADPDRAKEQLRRRLVALLANLEHAQDDLTRRLDEATTHVEQLEADLRIEREAAKQREAYWTRRLGHCEELEAIVLGGKDQFLNDLKALIDSITETMNQAIARESEIQSQLQNLLVGATQDWEDRFTHVDRHLSEQEETSVHVRIDPQALTTDDLSTIDACLRSMNEIRTEIDGHRNLYRDLVQRLEDTGRELTAIKRSNTEVKSRFRSLMVIHSCLKLDPFGIAKTTPDRVRQKIAYWDQLDLDVARIRQRAADGLSALDHRLTMFEQRLRTLDEQLSGYRDALVIDQYEDLGDDKKFTVKAMILTFEGPQDSISIKSLTAVLQNSGVATGEEGAEEIAVFGRTLPFFVRKGIEKFGMIGISELGDYWRQRWSRSDPEIVEIIGGERDLYRRRRDEERSASRAASGVRRLAREQDEAEAAAALERQRVEEEQRQRQLRNPYNILNGLNGMERGLLSALSFIEAHELPHPRDYVLWTKILAAAVGSHLIAVTNEGEKVRRDLVESLKGFLTRQPALFQVGLEHRRIEPTIVCANVCRLLPTPSILRTNLFVGLLKSKPRHWSSDAYPLYEALQGPVRVMIDEVFSATETPEQQSEP